MHWFLASARNGALALVADGTALYAETRSALPTLETTATCPWAFSPGDCVPRSGGSIIDGALHRVQTGGSCRDLSTIQIAKLELFGSAANGQFKAEKSNLDSLVDFETTAPVNGAPLLCMLFALEDLFGRHVDLVDVTAIRNPYFLQSIAKDRVVVYAA